MFKLCRRECSMMIRRLYDKHVESCVRQGISSRGINFSILGIGGDTNIIYINGVPYDIDDIHNGVVPTFDTPEFRIEWHQFTEYEFSFLTKYFSLDELTDISLLHDDDNNYCMEENQIHFSLCGKYSDYNTYQYLNDIIYDKIRRSGFNVRMVYHRASLLVYIRFYSIDDYMRFKLVISPNHLNIRHDLVFTQQFLDAFSK